MSEPTISTKERLALVLEENGLSDMARRARKGRFDDYESDSATPMIDLVRELKAAGCKDLADRAANGEWDGTREESRAWARSPDGQAAFRRLSEGG